MAKKTNTVSPSPVKGNNNATPIIRGQKLFFLDNEYIPESRLEVQDRENGRVPAYDVTRIVSPVLTSARTSMANNPTSETVDNGFDLFLQELENLTVNDSKVATPKKKEKAGAITGKTKRTASSQKKEKDVDGDWTETESETEEVESLFSTNSSLYDEENEDDLAWSIKDDEDNNVASEDLYSPERAKGLIDYWVPDSFAGTVKNVRRSSRNSFGSATGKKK